MKKLRNVLGLFAGASLLLTGCLGGKTSPFPPVQTAIYVSADGSLYTALREDLREVFGEVGQELSGGAADAEALLQELLGDDGPVEEELSAMAEREASAYIADSKSPVTDKPAVQVHTCQVKDGVATLVYEYGSPEALVEFTERTQDMENHPEALAITTVGQGLVEGMVSDGSWIRVDKKSPVELKEVLAQSDRRLVSVRGAVTVQTEGRILYCSGDVTVKDAYTAEIAGGNAYLVFQ